MFPIRAIHQIENDRLPSAGTLPMRAGCIRNLPVLSVPYRSHLHSSDFLLGSVNTGAEA